MSIIWLNKEDIIAAHDETINKNGGSHGLLNAGALEAALVKPLNLNYYEGITDLCTLAACYAYGLVKNHCFVDGNKRVGFLAAFVFLEVNGLTLMVSREDGINKFLWLAEHTGPQEVVQALLAQWLREKTITA